MTSVSSTSSSATGTPGTFRAAIESNDPDALRAVLHPDIEFCSPAVYRPYRDLDTVITLIGVVFEIMEDFCYTGAIRQGDDEMLRFTARVAERDIEGVDLVRYGPDGMVHALTVMIRPHSGLSALAERAGQRLAELKTTP